MTNLKALLGNGMVTIVTELKVDIVVYLILVAQRNVVPVLTANALKESRLLLCN